MSDIDKLIIANIATIAVVLGAAFRAIWWMSKLDSRVDDSKECAVRAHIRIDKLEAKEI
jgi:hypothetical protein